MGVDFGIPCLCLMIHVYMYVKNFDIWLDERLDLNTYVNNLVSRCYRFLENIGRIRNVRTKTDAEMLVHDVSTIRSSI